MKLVISVILTLQIFLVFSQKQENITEYILASNVLPVDYQATVEKDSLFVKNNLSEESMVISKKSSLYKQFVKFYNKNERLKSDLLKFESDHFNLSDSLFFVKKIDPTESFIGYLDVNCQSRKLRQLVKKLNAILPLSDLTESKLNIVPSESGELLEIKTFNLSHNRLTLRIKNLSLDTITLCSNKFMIPFKKNTFQSLEYSSNTGLFLKKNDSNMALALGDLKYAFNQCGIKILPKEEVNIFDHLTTKALLSLEGEFKLYFIQEDCTPSDRDHNSYDCNRTIYASNSIIFELNPN